MERFFKYTLTVLISTVAAMEFYQVVMRYILELPVMGLEELLVYPTLWLYFLGSVNASREDTQIKANVLDVFLKTDRSKLIVRVIADLLSVIVASWLTYWRASPWQTCICGARGRAKYPCARSILAPSRANPLR